MTKPPLIFVVKVREYLRLKRLSFAEAAKKSGMTHDRFEDIMTGEHEPRGSDTLRICYGLDIWPEPESLENRA